ncbi:hypothetical protein EG426_22290, partial [Salmonella enterica]|nr:hypothetical protein [Salmonella enterica]ECK9449581.1 hypothetical protein [Salmonella enterica subsp. enterica serovar Typhi str. CFSAN000626]HAD2922146.1 hypothetical protein [Salmonella enterica subsp. enterica]HAE7812319.1 hypothetical protein [Salmonella enterica subsp. enterica serovar Typhi]EAN9007591.1 hypothetical protein [Salmonella enterica]
TLYLHIAHIFKRLPVCVPDANLDPLFSLLSFDLSVVSAELFLHSHGENRFPEDLYHDDNDGIFCRYSVR